MFRSRPGKITLGVGAALVAFYLAENLGAERFGATALLLYLPQHGWGLLPLVLLFWTLWRRQFRLAGFSATLVLFWAHALLGFRFFGALTHRGESHSLRLMTYNIERGAGGVAALEAAIRAQNPDIVCLQESQGVHYGRGFAPGAQIAARFPGWSAAQGGDVLTMSRLPMRSHRDSPLRGTRRLLETTFDTPQGAVRVLNVHVSTSFSAQSRTARGAKAGRIGRVLLIVADAKPAAQARMAQIAPLQKAIARDPKIPLLLAGDFNSPPRGGFYGAISRGLDDAWTRGGTGAGSTFPARFPLLPIDHVLSRGVLMRRAWVPKVRASDHRPLVVDFRLNSTR